MRKYTVQLDDSKDVLSMSYIGLNHTVDGKDLPNIISSYNKNIDSKDEIIVSNNEEGLRIAKLGDITKAYQLLRTEIVSRDPRDVEAYLECVQQAVIQYFGPYSNREKRIKFYPTEEEVKSGKRHGRISEFGKPNNRDLALSLERAVLAQNLMIWCCVDIDSYLKISETTINGKDRVHSYNLVHDGLKDKYYICDFSIPSFREGRIHPIICELPKVVYEKMISPLPNVGYSVEVDYLNEVNGKNYLITYDAGRDDVYKVESSRVKKKV